MTHIDGEHIEQAAHDADAVAEEYGISRWCRSRRIEHKDLMRVAEQRAMRFGMILAFTSGTVHSVSANDGETLRAFSSMWMDGFAAGMNAQIQREIS